MITLALPTSDPVPAVVGTAIIGDIASLLARVHQSPISSKSQIGRLWPDMKATIFPRSIADPPPKAQSPHRDFHHCIPEEQLQDSTSLGLGSTSKKTELSKPDDFNIAKAFCVISS